MTECLKCKDMMIEALYGELGEAEKRAFDEHLGACPECASEYSVLGATLRVMDGRKRSDPGPEFWDGYFDRLSRRMEAEGGRETAGTVPPSLPLRARIARLFSSLPRWSYQVAGAAALLLVGILIGRGLLVKPNTLVTAENRTGGGATDDQVRLLAASDAASDRAYDYLERSKVLLLGLVNYDPGTEDPYALDLPRRKEVSRGLVSEAADIRSGLTSPGQSRLKELVSELERILLQIANLEAGQNLDAVEIVKEGVEQTGLFLKIDLTRMARDAGGPAPKKASGLSDKPKL
jgi:hypothetical protein